MKISIHTKTKDGAWGGGNQFLKALSNKFRERGILATENQGDAVIFNGYQDMFALAKFRLFRPTKKALYRLGPILSLHRKGWRWKIVDHLVIVAANIFAHLAVFQSKWSHQEALKRGFKKNKKFVIIGNAVDTSVFYRKDSREKFPGEPSRLVYSSWSPNMKKGFKYLKFLDENLDFKKYEFTFIGNSPFEFKNIKMLKPLPSVELATKLRDQDIFVSPVADDACSNALLEGLASGLPVVALESGGNPELVREGGELFSNEEELLAQIDKVAKNLKSYYDAIQVKSISEIADEYISAIRAS